MTKNIKRLQGMINALTHDLDYDIEKDDRERKVKEIDALTEAVTALKAKHQKTKNMMTDWGYLNDMHNELAENYFSFSRAKKAELLRNFNIDCGTDYANYIFNVGKIEY